MASRKTAKQSKVIKHKLKEVGIDTASFTYRKTGLAYSNKWNANYQALLLKTIELEENTNRALELLTKNK